MVRSGRSETERLRVVGLGVLAAALLLVASPAQAARQITPPQWFACGTYYRGTISVGPPRIWASYNRPEQIVWIIQVQRWDTSGQRWYSYGRPFATWSTFDYYGRSVTSWSSFNTTNGGRFVNSAFQLPVAHTGSYRLAVTINSNAGGATWTGFVRGGASCYMN